MFKLNPQSESYVLVYKSIDGTHIILNNSPRPIISYGLDLCGVKKENTYTLKNFTLLTISLSLHFFYS